ncbi:MAG: TonB-dependent receptor [Bacteroidota bacterium]
MFKTYLPTFFSKLKVGPGSWGLSLMLCFLLPWQAMAQEFTLSGVVRAKASGETIIGASIVLPSLNRGTYTNTYGFFSLNVPAGDDSVEVRITYAGYQTILQKILVKGDIRLDIDLINATLDEVVIEAESFKEQLNSTQMSVQKITIEEAKKLPALFGEVDIIKTLQLKPGVSSGSEGSSGIFVRGGGPDQNLVLLDNTVVYNPSHLFGFFSTFNSDAVKDVKIYKGGFPGQYGGRLSSVIDVKMKEGNQRKFSGAGGLGLIASRLTLEGPIVEDKISFIISGRRTYADLITSAINEASSDNPDFNPIPDYFFYDLNGKINYQISDKDQLYLSGYFGRDRFLFDNEPINFNFTWGNTNGALRWNHFFSSRLFVNTSISVTDYEYVIANQFDQFGFELGSKITDQSLRTDFTWLPHPKHTVRFGASAINHRFNVGRLEAQADSSDVFDFQAGDLYYAMEYGVYIGDDIEVNDKLKINVGLRASAFQDFSFLVNDPDPRPDSTYYANIEPRASAKYSLSEKISLKASYARMVQYLHLVASTGSTLPTDVWYPSTSRVKPQISDQVAAGISIAIGDQFLLTNEVYYKWFQNQIDFKGGANLFVNDDLESEFVFGRGWAYGNEFYIEKTKGKLTGWIGYTLSWTLRQFADTIRTPEGQIENVINNGEPFFARNDKRHDISIVALYELPRTWTNFLTNKVKLGFKKLKSINVSASWEFRSGNAYTLAPGYLTMFGPNLASTLFNTGDVSADNFGLVNLVPRFDDRNNVRLPDYHKLDVGIVIAYDHKWGESDITISAYNAYSRRNAYFVYLEPRENEQGIPIGQSAQKVSLFPILPSITWNFKF